MIVHKHLPEMEGAFFYILGFAPKSKRLELVCSICFRVAKRLYEHLGIVQTHIKKKLLVMLGGFGNQIVMKIEVDKAKKGK